jgi:GxxExxY protein
VEFELRKIAYNQQKAFSIIYKDVEVREFIPDLVVSGAVIVDTKTIDQITDHEREKMVNYLRLTKLRVGLIINFKDARLGWVRLVL